MKAWIASSWNTGREFMEKYGIVVGALGIYGYYLLVSLNLFSHQKMKGGLLSLFLQFDSLILMWGVMYVVVQLQKYRKEKTDQEKEQQNLYMSYERQRIQLTSLDEITEMLNDKINNPLSIISLSTGSLRRKTERDSELGAYVERIESALKRVQEVMVGVHGYHAKKIVRISKEVIDLERQEGMPGLEGSVRL